MVWSDIENYEEYLIEYWGDSSIEWQQENRNILNKAIKTFNEYVLGIEDLDNVKKETCYAELKLKNQCGTYMEDIKLIKQRVEEIEEMRSNK